MAILVILIVLGMYILALDCASNERIHVVGGSDGWTWSGKYSTWASGETFLVGDIIKFEFTTDYDVAEATSSEYGNCTTSNYVYTTSPVNFTLDKAQTYYYICTKECKSWGMKVAATVVLPPSPPPPPPPPPPSPPSPQSPTSQSPTSTAAPTSPVVTNTSPPPPGPKSPSSAPKSKTKLVVIVAVIIAFVLTTSILVYFIYVKTASRQTKPDSARAFDVEKSLAHKFTYKELAQATGNFSEPNLLGQGGFGRVYKAVLQTTEILAVKMFTDSEIIDEQFEKEIKSIGCAVHKNLVGLKGWCCEKRHRILVYDFMPNKSLDKHLFGTEMPLLSWKRRYGIVQDVAEGLQYLHFDLKNSIIHLDIKAANILLDDKFVAHLGDFGLAEFLQKDKVLKTMREHAGTRGYMSPEMKFRKGINQKTDIFSFGMLLLEIACGKHASKPLWDEVWDAKETNKLLAVADTNLKSVYDKTEMELVLSLGLHCAHPNWRSRPTSKECSSILRDKRLVDLPSKRPDYTVATAISKDSEVVSSSKVASTIRTIKQLSSKMSLKSSTKKQGEDESALLQDNRHDTHVDP